MSQPWFRFYSEMLADRKIAHLVRVTQQPKALVVGVWATILALANDSPIRGKLLLTENCPVGIEELADVAGLDIDEADAIVSQLIRVGMLDLIDDVYEVSGWSDYQAPIPRPSDWDVRRTLVFTRDRGRCVYCTRKAEHVDHIHPRSRGGTDEMENLVAACASCNMSKHDFYWRGWYAEQPFYDPDREKYIELVLSGGA